MTKKKQNGITLIALVITIVVLLILAGVSIMTLTGDNGLLTRTTTAKQKTEEAGVIENIRLAYQSAKIGEYAGETGDFATKFQMELAKVYSNPTVTQGENGTYTVGVPEGNFIVNSTGSVEKKSGVSVTAAQIAARPSTYYGQEVLNYTKGGTYRIFFVDEKTTKYPNGYFGDIGANEQYKIYLKADWTANDVNLGTEGANTYTPIDTTKLAKMNPSWWSARSTATWNANEKCAAYLCDPTTSESTSNQEWAAYFDSGKADYVIGSPSVEMYVKSYNQAHGTPTYLGASYRDDSAVATGYGYNRTQGYIYTINGAQSTGVYYTGTDTLDYENFNSMYCGKQVNNAGTKGEYYWWLASPSVCYSSNMCYVYGVSANLASQTYGTKFGICPLVSLKSNFTPQISE